MRSILGGFTWLLFQVVSGTGQSPLPFVDQGACPFECRQYGHEIANRANKIVVGSQSRTPTLAVAQVTLRSNFAIVVPCRCGGNPGEVEVALTGGEL